MLAGKALRLGRIPPGQGQERKLLNDSLIYLQARKVGAAVLTRNLRDFDLLEQLVPSGTVMFYEVTMNAVHATFLRWCAASFTTR